MLFVLHGIVYIEHMVCRNESINIDVAVMILANHDHALTRVNCTIERR